MKRAILIAVPIVIAVLVAGVWATYDHFKLPDTWFEKMNLPMKSPDSAIAFEDAALFDTIIPMPEVRSLSARCKFVKRATDRRNMVSLGYVFTVEMANLDTKKLPEKYKTKTEITTKAGTFETLPMEQAPFDVHCEFTLVDKDGFKLAELRGPRHTIMSGKANILQDIVPGSFPHEIVKRTADVVPKVVVERCQVTE